MDICTDTLIDNSILVVIARKMLSIVEECERTRSMGMDIVLMHVLVFSIAVKNVCIIDRVSDSNKHCVSCVTIWFLSELSTC